MINWIAGQTDRFRCLVTHDGLFDTRSGFFETDELWFPTWEFGSKFCITVLIESALITNIRLALGEHDRLRAIQPCAVRG